MSELNRPTQYEVVDGVFTGYIMCDDRSNGDFESLGIKAEYDTVWLKASIDLRSVILMRVRGFDDDAGITALETNETVFNVSAPHDELLPHFRATRRMKPTFA